MSSAFTRLLLSCLFFLMLCPAQANTLDFGDLPEPKYPTKLAADGARHITSQSLYLGLQPPDVEADGLANPLANGDDLTGAPDDEDAIRPPALYPVPGASLAFPIKATNSTGGTAKIFGFADWNADGDFADANETSIVAVPTGSAGVFFWLPWSVPATATTTQPVAVRLRLSLDSALGPTGLAQNGEVEDFFIVVRSAWRDYGDLPDSASGSLTGSFSGGAVPDYRTRAADNGPSHVLRDGLNFRNDSASGDLDVDAESDGQPSVAANGDDTNLDDDEAGLTLTEFDSHYSAAAYGTPARDVWFEFTMPVTNTTGTTAQVQAFIDWNQDGNFTDDIDNIGLYGMIDPVVGDGSQTSVRIRAALALDGSYGTPSAFTRTLAMRLRISTDASLTAEGPASDGEVHDQLITLNFAADPGTTPRFDYGDLPSLYAATLSIDDGARHLSDQTLYLGTLPGDHEPDGQPSTLANGDDTTATNDENALPASSLLPVPGMPITFPVRATNVTGIEAAILGFVDWNADGDFEDDDEISSLAVPTGSTNVLFRMPWNVPVTASTTAPVAVRLRLTTDTHLGAYGFARDGEVEDCFIVVRPQGTVKDYGDLPDSVAGTAAGTFGTGSPPDYKTRSADGGPSHGLRPGLFFTNDSGSADADVDGEADGQPTSLADGDDLDTDDDEKGLITALTSQTFIPDGMNSRLDLGLQTSLPVTNTTGTSGQVVAFIDANSDGDFADAGEQAPAIPVPGDGSVTAVTPTFAFTIGSFAPATSFSRTFALRFRITTDSTIGSEGAATDGEVHDELLTLSFQIPPYDTTPLDFGDLPAPYKTLRSDNGARHVPTQSLYLGTQPPDSEVDGLPSPLSNGDDADATDDENAIRPPGIHAVPGSPITFPIKATNVTGSMAKLYGFADWNADGDFADANETSSLNVPHGSAAAVFNLTWNVPASASTTAPVAVRLRLATATSLGPVGRADDGEVEDFFIVVRSAWLDYGDLPDSASGSLAGSFSGGAVPDYRTRAADNGPSHVLRDGLNFRNDTASGDLAVDGESDGQPTAAANGDDTNFDDDEVGLTMTDFYSHYSPTGYGTGTPLRDTAVDFTIPVTNTTGTTAKVHAFIDWDEDGDFTDYIDNLDNVGFVQTVVGDGSQTTVRIWATVDLFGSYANPAAFTKTLAMRLRISTDASLTAEGPASDGEVHDQLITLNFEEDPPDYGPIYDYGDLPAPYDTLDIDNGASHRAVQELYLGSLAGDPEYNALPSTLANGDNTDATNDEDALSVATLLPVPGMPIRFPLRATNVSSRDAMISGFVDWNADGDFADTGETSSIVVPAGSTNVLFRLPWNVPATASTTAPVAVRLRIHYFLGSTPTPIGPNGHAHDGEVEDYFITVHAAGTVKDYGDLPDSASGTQTGSFNVGALHTPDYRTRAADNGPSHVLRPGLSMSGGAMLASTWVDGESDGQPTAVANGDDLSGDADEETIPVLSTPGAFVEDGICSALNLQLAPFLSVTNSTGSTARLAAFIDLNSDGDFDDPGEQAPIELVPSGGSTPTTISPRFSFQLGGFTPTPMLSVVTRTFATRYRLTTDTTVGPDGPATDGEVHDALLTVDLTIPPFSGADLDFGDMGIPYETARADNGARHVITPQLFLGTVQPDGEPDGWYAGFGRSDDWTGTDDEDGMSPWLIYAHPGLPVKFPVRVHNTTGGPATLYGFTDWNSDGDFLDADETSLASVPNSTTGIVHLDWNVPASAATTQRVPVRLRIATATTLSHVGPTGDGEVEDHDIFVTPAEYDFDDLPDSSAGTAPGVVTKLTTVSQADYRTRLADNGPRHVIRPDLVLFDDTNPSGIQIDAEADGGNDSTTGPASESPVYSALNRVALNNITSTTADLSIEMVTSIALKNETGSTATLHGFMDANNDGDFTDAGETTSLAVPSAAGYSAALLTFTPEFVLTKPITTFTRTVPIRFRLSTNASLGPDGPAPDGEVQSTNLTFTFKCSQWWPNEFGYQISELLDRGSNSRMNGISHFGQGQQVNNETWTIGQTGFTGPNPLLNTSFLNSLGTGRVQYSHRGRLPDGSLHAWLGFLKVRNLPGYRAFMGTHQLTGDTDTPEADSDGDGVSNFDEFAFGTHPGQSGERPVFKPESSGNGAGGSQMVLSYLRRAGGTMNGTAYATPEVIYQPGASLDLLSWDTPMEVPIAPPPDLPTPRPGYEWGAIRLNVPSQFPQRGFVRLITETP